MFIANHQLCEQKFGTKWHYLQTFSSTKYLPWLIGCFVSNKFNTNVLDSCVTLQQTVAICFYLWLSIYSFPTSFWQNWCTDIMHASMQADYRKCSRQTSRWPIKTHRKLTSLHIIQWNHCIWWNLWGMLNQCLSLLNGQRHRTSPIHNWVDFTQVYTTF